MGPFGKKILKKKKKVHGTPLKNCLTIATNDNKTPGYISGPGQYISFQFQRFVELLPLCEDDERGASGTTILTHGQLTLVILPQSLKKVCWNSIIIQQHMTLFIDITGSL